MSASKGFDKYLEKATSSFLLEPDWDSILKVCDYIRQDDVQAKYAINQLKKKLASDNIYVVSFALQCLESIVKNCGKKIHQEIAKKDFLDFIKQLALTKPDPIKNKVLELIQCWAHAFKKNPNYKIVEDYYNSMKLEDFKFQHLNEADAMFDVDEAPAWIEDADSSHCYRCRSEFSIAKRRHHCRACGQIFCHACSSKTSPIPKYGIEKEVRVCDACYDKLNRVDLATSTSATGLSNLDRIQEYAKNSGEITAKKSNEKTEQEFEDEIQLALALSQSEIEANQKAKSSASLSTANYQNGGSFKNKSSKQQTTKEKDTDSQSSSNSSSQQLYENLNTHRFNASAPTSDPSPSPQQQQMKHYTEPMMSQQYDDMKGMSHQMSETDDMEIRMDKEINSLVDEIKSTLELFINRMKSNSARGRSITNDTAVQSLFLQLQSQQPRLLAFIQYQEDARAYYENLQDKLTQLKDAREVLNSLRHEHFEKKEQEKIQMEKMRQLQIAQKLQAMRQQKQSYFHYQNELNLQKLQLQEKDLQNRLEQQRQLVLERDSVNNAYFQPPGQLASNPPNEIQYYNNSGYPSGQYAHLAQQTPQYIPIGGAIPVQQPANLLPQQQQQQQQPTQYPNNNDVIQQQQPQQLPYMIHPANGQYYPITAPSASAVINPIQTQTTANTVDTNTNTNGGYAAEAQLISFD